MHPTTLALLLLALPLTTLAQQPPDAADAWSPSGAGTGAVSFRPSVAIVVGVFSIMFSLTFLLLIYAKFCHSAATQLFTPTNPSSPSNTRLSSMFLPQHRFSGLDKAAVEALPFFPFASLRGARKGLDCAVCLAPFDDADLLRLLPNCKHAFHLACIDHWLGDHASCPLCRARVDPQDVLRFNTYSSRFLFASDRHENLELFVEREAGNGTAERRGSSKFNLGTSFRLIEARIGRRERKDEILGDLDRFKHRIVCSDVVFKGRWSDLNSRELMSLNSDLLSLGPSRSSDSTIVESSNGAEVKGISDEKVLRIKEELERKRMLEVKAGQIGRAKEFESGNSNSNNSNSVSGGNAGMASISASKRSMSEITNLSRFRMTKDSGSAGSLGGPKDEKVRKLWLPIARRTVQWLAGRERRAQDSIAESTIV